MYGSAIKYINADVLTLLLVRRVNTLRQRLLTELNTLRG